MSKRLTEKELGERWNLSTKTLQTWRSEGDGPTWIDIGKNTIRYREEDVIAYEESRLKGNVTIQGKSNHE